MTRAFLLFRPLFCLGVAAVASSFAIEPPQPGPVLTPGVNDAEWTPLFARLAQQSPVRSTFTEYRWFSIRKTPVVLHGELRHAPGRGLSLHYTEPRDEVMIVDHAGLLLREANGRARSLPNGSKAVRIDTVLLPVLTFDLAALRENFTVHAARDGADWRLDFVPRTADLQRQLGTLTVFAMDDHVRRLEFRRSATQRVVVVIEKTETRVTFTPEELKRFFR